MDNIAMPQTLDDWKAYIAEATQIERRAGNAVVEAIIEKGRRISEFHEAFKRNQRWGNHWEDVCQKTIGMSRDMCYRYMIISKNIMRPPHNILPSSLEALFHLSRVIKADPKAFDDAVATGEINPKMFYRTAKAIAERTESKSKQPPRGRPRKVQENTRPNRLFQERLAAGPYKHLTPAEVDPEFTGTKTEWTDKYGHVQAMTAAEYAAMRFSAWVFNMRALVSEGKRQPDWPEVDHNWLRAPKPRDIVRLTEALDYLRPKLAEAEALLARAREAQPPRADPPAQDLPQPAAESTLTV